MEKIFQPGKWFVLFCGLLVFVYFSLQYVANARLEEIGRVFGTQIFTWEWPDGEKDLYSSAVINESRVLKRTETEAVVAIKVKQRLEMRGDSKVEKPLKQSDAQAELTFYKTDKEWRLGKVELK